MARTALLAILFAAVATTALAAPHNVATAIDEDTSFLANYLDSEEFQNVDIHIKIPKFLEKILEFLKCGFKEAKPIETVIDELKIVVASSEEEIAALKTALLKCKGAKGLKAVLCNGEAVFNAAKDVTENKDSVAKVIGDLVQIKNSIQRCIAPAV